MYPTPSTPILPPSSCSPGDLTLINLQLSRPSGQIGRKNTTRKLQNVLFSQNDVSRQSEKPLIDFSRGTSKNHSSGLFTALLLSMATSMSRALPGRAPTRRLAGNPVTVSFNPGLTPGAIGQIAAVNGNEYDSRTAG